MFQELQLLLFLIFMLFLHFMCRPLPDEYLHTHLNHVTLQLTLKLQFQQNTSNDKVCHQLQLIHMFLFPFPIQNYPCISPTSQFLQMWLYFVCLINMMHVKKNLSAALVFSFHVKFRLKKTFLSLIHKNQIWDRNQLELCFVELIINETTFF